MRDWIDYAKSLLAARKKTIDDLKEKKIRVVRVLLFEGEAAAVFKQLAKSLPVGEHDLSGIKIVVIQDDYKILE